jgi:uncharacterized protein YkwD
MPAIAPPAPPPLAIVADINRVRAQHLLPRLKASRSLVNMAVAHDSDMLANGFFSHDGEGTDFLGRVRRHVRFSSVGEAIAWTTGRTTPWTIVRMWMKSPPHRAELLNPRYRRIGVSDAFGQLGPYGAGVVVTADLATNR